MPRFLLGIALAVFAFGATKALTEDVGLAVFVACMVAIGIWFKGFELLLDGLWAVVRAVVD